MMDMCHSRIGLYVNQLPREVVFNMFVYSKQEAINFFSNSSFPARSGNVRASFHRAAVIQTAESITS